MDECLLWYFTLWLLFTKPFTGTLAARLVAEGTLDETKTVATYVPELKNSAFGDATVRQVMDMTKAVKYSEDYADVDP